MGIDNRPLGLQDSNYHVDPNIYSDEEFRGEYTGQNLIYKGFARPGASVNEPVWQIAFLTYDGDDNVLSVQWPLSLNPNNNLSQSETVGTVTTPWTTFTGDLDVLPIVPGSVIITVGAVTFRDTLKNGILTGSPATNTGTIDYGNGDIALAFNPALLMDTAVTATYSTYSLGGASNDYQFSWAARHSYTYV